jgi:hypothetical protein
MSDSDAIAAAEAKLNEAFERFCDLQSSEVWDSYGAHGSHTRAVAMNRGLLAARRDRLDALRGVQAVGGGPSPWQVQEAIDTLKAEIADHERWLKKMR